MTLWVLCFPLPRGEPACRQAGVRERGYRNFSIVFLVDNYELIIENWSYE